MLLSSCTHPTKVGCNKINATGHAIYNYTIMPTQTLKRANEKKTLMEQNKCSKIHFTLHYSH